VQHPSGDYTASSTILPLRLTIIFKAGVVGSRVLWRSRNFPEFMFLLSSPVHCATLQKIKNWTTPRQMPTILQDNTLLQLGMCLAGQIWFVQGIGWSVTDWQQNSEQCSLTKYHVADRYQNMWTEEQIALPPPTPQNLKRKIFGEFCVCKTEMILKKWRIRPQTEWCVVLRLPLLYISYGSQSNVQGCWEIQHCLMRNVITDCTCSSWWNLCLHFLTVVNQNQSDVTQAK
jgi:hypothetical protein